jgi:predicted porin
MKKGVKWLLPAAAALGMTVAAPAQAVDVKAGDWDLSFTGNVNAFATYTRCGVANDTVVGGLACTKAENAPNTFAIESGLLPSAFVFTAKTRAYNLDVSATIGLYPGLHVTETRTGNGVDPDNQNATGLFTMDVRQNFLTLGDKSWGTVKLGKDLGIFGSDAILSDMTLLGVGAGTAGATVAAGNVLHNRNVTVGHIGTGYMYADWIPQIAYISPSFSGLQLTVAAYEPFQNGDATARELPGVQAKVTYDLAGPVSGRVWVGGLYQNTKVVAPPDNPSVDAVAGEAGVKVNVSGLGALAYGYYGKGIGTFAVNVLSAADNAAGLAIEERNSYGFFGQVTYAIPNTKFRPGLSYGMSFLDKAGTDVDSVLVKSNALLTAALFYAATDTLTLVAEFDHVRSKNHLDGLAKTNSFALGGIMFF